MTARPPRSDICRPPPPLHKENLHQPPPPTTTRTRWLHASAEVGRLICEKDPARGSSRRILLVAIGSIFGQQEQPGMQTGQQPPPAQQRRTPAAAGRSNDAGAAGRSSASARTPRGGGGGNSSSSSNRGRNQRRNGARPKRPEESSIRDEVGHKECNQHIRKRTRIRLIKFAFFTTPGCLDCLHAVLEREPR
jgi:hypothetical protein